MSATITLCVSPANCGRLSAIRSVPACAMPGSLWKAASTGALRVRFRGHYLKVHACPLPVKTPPARTGRHGPLAPHRNHGSLWMQGFNLRRAPSLSSILQKEGR